jgi:predicted nucleic acid-binding protein
MIYLDTSALLKLLVEESESETLASWISAADAPMISSELAKLEVIRAARRIDVGAVPAARALVGQLDLIPISGSVLDEAADVGNPMLRSLDAIHLASALSIRTHVTAFVAYDHRLVDAAHTAGLPVTQPG